LPSKLSIQSNFVNRFIDRRIRFYLGNFEKYKTNNPENLERLHKIFWRQPNNYYESTKNRTNSFFIPIYHDYIQQVAPILKEKQICHICEFGTGDGQWLYYLSQQYSFINKFLGIDISCHQIKKNTKSYPDLTFICSDIIEWIDDANNLIDYTLYHSNGGVLEYLSEPSLRHLFNNIKTQTKNSMLLLIEPLSENFDINHDTESRIEGNEFSFSHNYVYLLIKSKFSILHYKEIKVIYFYRWLIVLAHN